MKATIVSLVLASIAGLMYCGDESLAGIQEPEDKELQAWLEARRDTLNKVLAILKAQADAGQGSIIELSRANTLLLEAELEAASSQKEATECFERALEVQAGIEETFKAMEEVGVGSWGDRLMATADRMKVEIDLYKAKKGSWPVSANHTGETPAAVQGPDDEELQALLEARRDTLRDAVRVIRQKVEVGLATSGDLANQDLLVLAAELELAKSPRERIAIYEKMVKNQKDIEQILGLELESGVGSRMESLNATAARIKAEIQLHQARKGKWPVVKESGRENPAVDREPEDKELQTLLEARRDTLRKVVQLIEQQEATTSVFDLTNANTEFLEAELELVSSQQERIAIFEKILDTQTELEQGVREIVKEGRASVTELLIATAARMKAEIDLHKARKKVK